MEVVGFLLAVLDADIGRDVVHRARPVERHQRDQVLEAVGLELGQDVAHAAAFHLEDPVGIAFGQHPEGRLVIERDLRDVDLVPADLLDRLLDHGEGFQAEEVELHQARRLDPFHVELGGRQRFLAVGIAVERHELVERPVADHDAGGMGRGVAVEALELQRQVDQPLDLLVGAVLLLQELLALQRLRQGHRLGGIVGHQLADPVDLTVGHAQHAADVAQHGAGLQLAEGDDRRHAVVAVFIAHVADHPVALVLAEVDIEVRHRHAFGIEEALEQQAPAQRVEVGDLERPGDQRARARAAAGPDRDAVVLGPLDEVGNDQEVAREAHLLDHVELVGEPVLVGLELDIRRQPAAFLQGREAALGHFLQRVLLRASGKLGVARQDRLARRRHVGAALGDHQSVVAGLRQVGEEIAHLGGRLEVVLRRQAAAVGILDMRALLDAQQHVMRLVHRGLGKVDIVGRHQRQPAFIGEIDQRALDAALPILAMALHFDVKPAIEQGFQVFELMGRCRRLTCRQQPTHAAAHAADQGQQSVGIAFQLGERQRRLRAGLELEMGAAHQPHQVEVACLVLDQEGEPVGRRRLAHRRDAALLLTADAEIAADDRLNAGL